MFAGENRAPFRSHQYVAERGPKTETTFRKEVNRKLTQILDVLAGKREERDNSLDSS